MAVKKIKAARESKKEPVKKRAGSQRRAVKKSEITEDTPLLAMEQKFADEFLIDFNQTNAAIRAGYSPKSARHKASQLRKQINIAAYIARKIAESSTRNGIEFDRVMREAARIAFVNPLNVLDTRTGSIDSDVSDDDAAAIASVKVKIMSGDIDSEEREVKFHAKDKAMDLILKYVKASAEFKEKMKIEREKLALQKRQLEIEERKLAILEENVRKEREGDRKIIDILDPFGEGGSDEG